MAIDLYELIGVSPSASITEIRTALAKQQREWNARQQAPDLTLRHEAESRMQQLAEARKVLLNPEARAAFDRERQPVGAGSSQQAGPIPGFRPPPPIQPSQPLPPPPIRPPIYQQPDQPRPPQRPSLSTNKKWRWVGIGVAAIIAISVISAIASGHPTPTNNAVDSGGQSGGGTPTPTPSPTLNNQAAAIQTVVAAVTSCAQAATPQPANCPQQGQGQDSIVWKVYGNVGDGAIVVQDPNNPSEFDILGTTVMTETWSQNGTSQLLVDNVNFDGTVDSTGKLLSLGQPLSGIPTNVVETITKPRPADLTDAAAKAAVAAAFKQCVAVHVPVWCPDQPQPNSSDRSDSMKSNVDPLLNTNVTYDASYGVVHVVGSYSMTLSSVPQYGTSGTQDFTGNYDAMLADNNGQPIVMEIKST